jgi:hypothetical protein
MEKCFDRDGDLLALSVSYEALGWFASASRRLGQMLSAQI